MKTIKFQLQKIAYNLLYGIRYNIKHKKIIRDIKKTGVCRTVFVVSSLPMMRYNGLIDLLLKDERFDVNIIIVPLKDNHNDAKSEAVRQLCNYFDSKGIIYKIGDKNHPETKVWLKKYSPNLMFYTQPYRNSLEIGYDWYEFRNSALFCYQCYGFNTVSASWSKNLRYHNISWRIFAANNYEKTDYQKYCFTGGKNVVVTMDSHADDFMKEEMRNPWKHIESDNTLKKIIFAPHFQIFKKSLFNRGSFNWLADFMLDMASKYEEYAQFAFKPHPLLRNALYGHPDWGKEKTDKYYAAWENGKNTQLETGDYIDLFKTSDAMIHNCGSFTAEYLFTGNPALFTTDDKTEITDYANEFGIKCIDMHYLAENCEMVEDFIKNVVLGDKDPLKESRHNFRGKELMPLLGSTAAENMYNEIKIGFGFD